MFQRTGRSWRICAGECSRSCRTASAWTTWPSSSPIRTWRSPPSSSPVGGRWRRAVPSRCSTPRPSWPTAGASRSSRPTSTTPRPAPTSLGRNGPGTSSTGSSRRSAGRPAWPAASLVRRRRRAGAGVGAQGDQADAGRDRRRRPRDRPAAGSPRWQPGSVASTATRPDEAFHRAARRRHYSSTCRRRAGRTEEEPPCERRGRGAGDHRRPAARDHPAHDAHRERHRRRHRRGGPGVAVHLHPAYVRGAQQHVALRRKLPSPRTPSSRRPTASTEASPRRRSRSA